MPDVSTLFLSIAIWAVPVVLAITLHEAAHGYVARMFGDPTAWEMGRVSINPLRHVDPVGTILLPGFIVLTNVMTGAHFPPFGWAKPVPVNFGRLRHPKRDMLWVAAAGPATNLAQAFVWALIAGLISRFMFDAQQSFVFAMALSGVMVNLALMLLNLIPIPPLDGGRIMVSLLPVPLALQLMKLERYGFFILIGLLYFGVLDKLLWPLLEPISNLLFFLTGS